MSEYVWTDKVSRRTANKQRQVEKEAQAKSEEDFLQAINAGAETSPYKVVGGQCEERLPIADGCTGLIVGKKGANLKDIEKKFKVQVSLEGLPDKRSGAPPEVGSIPEVVIRGPSHRDVEAAKKELDYDSKEIKVPREMVGWVCGKGNRHLKYLRDLTGVLVLNIARDPEVEAKKVVGSEKDEEDRWLEPVGEMKVAKVKHEEDDEDDEAADDEGQLEAVAAEGESDILHGNDSAASSECLLQVKGKRENVEDAYLCLETHMLYHDLFIDMQKAEQDLDRQLAEAKNSLGRRFGQGTQSNGNKGEKGASGAGREQGRGNGERGKGGRGRGGGKPTGHG